MAADNPAAPGDLEKVRRFVNTLDVEDGSDDVATSRALVRWLHQDSLLAGRTRADDGQVHRARQLRESLRDCMLANHERAATPAQARAVLNDVAICADLSLALDALGRWQVKPRAKGIDGALGRLVAIVASSMTTGEWERLKVCLSDTCRWAFYDHSPARTGRWCSMQICGNRAKQQAWRRRQT